MRRSYKLYPGIQDNENEWNNSSIKFDSNYTFGFRNENTKPQSQTVSTTLEIKKTIDGNDPETNKFKFNLDEGIINDSTKEFQLINDGTHQSNIENKNSTVTFDQLTYSKEGTYYYKLSEADPGNKYIAGQDIFAKVIVKIVDGKLKVNSKQYFANSNFTNEIKDPHKPTINNISIRFVLKKIDSNATATTLSDAKFTLKELTSLDTTNKTLVIGNSVTTDPVTTDNNGLATFNNLSKGKSYLLTEETPPTGYDVAGPWLVTIKEDGAIEFKAIKFTNDKKTSYKVVGETSTLNVKTIDSNPAKIGDKKKEYTLPSTGGIGTKKYYLLGTLLSMLGVIYIVMKLGKGGLFRKEDHS